MNIYSKLICMFFATAIACCAASNMALAQDYEQQNNAWKKHTDAGLAAFEKRRYSEAETTLEIYVPLLRKTNRTAEADKLEAKVKSILPAHE